MWPFAKRGSRPDGDADEPFRSDIDPRDFKDDKVVIKLWLPSKLLAGVEFTGQRHNGGWPDVLLAILFEHIVAALCRFQLARPGRQRQNQLTARLPDTRSMLRELDTYNSAYAATAGLIGKAEHGPKHELPIRSRDELFQLAEGADQPISEYNRDAYSGRRTCSRDR